jgi:hypothetical protein
MIVAKIERCANCLRQRIQIILRELYTLPTGDASDSTVRRLLPLPLIHGLTAYVFLHQGACGHQLMHNAINGAVVQLNTALERGLADLGRR